MAHKHVQRSRPIEGYVLDWEIEAEILLRLTLGSVPRAPKILKTALASCPVKNRPRVSTS